MDALRCSTRKSDCAQQTHTRRHVSPVDSLSGKRGGMSVRAYEVDTLAEALCYTRQRARSLANHRAVALRRRGQLFTASSIITRRTGSGAALVVSQRLRSTTVGLRDISDDTHAYKFVLVQHMFCVRGFQNTHHHARQPPSHRAASHRLIAGEGIYYSIPSSKVSGTLAMLWGNLIVDPSLWTWFRRTRRLLPSFLRHRLLFMPPSLLSP